MMHITCPVHVPGLLVSAILMVVMVMEVMVNGNGSRDKEVMTCLALDTVNN